MDIFNYCVFLTEAKYNSFLKVKELHNITLPAVSHIIKQLERQFGFAIMPRLTMYGMEDEVKILKNVPEGRRLIGVAVKNEKELKPAFRKALEYIKSFIYE